MGAFTSARLSEGAGPIRAATAEPRWVQWGLILIALSFLALFLVLPLVAVFAEAL